MMKQSNPAVSVVHMYQSFDDIYVREVHGRYTTWRWVCVWLTQLVFYGLPWLSWNGRQAVLFDLIARKFYLFGIVLLPQDFIYLALLLIICAYSLFLFTAITGRVWCGFSCPQTVYTEIFMWVERKIEGRRSARMRLDKQTTSPSKLIKKCSKHVVWIAIGLWTGFSFVGYFTEIHSLFNAVLNLMCGPWESFWILFYGFATYGNAGWMREQICRYLCPYARFQGAMFDADTLIVSYDKARGEPRTPFNKKSSNATAEGACIDCSLCVQVCPTGIDIRNGLQHDCIGCGACIDACDSVMDKIAAPRGLIRFTTENVLKHQLSLKQMKQRLWRPRIMIYSLILLGIIMSFSIALMTHAPIKLNILRDRNTTARETIDGRITNVYRLHIMNADEKTHRFKLLASGIDGIELNSIREIELRSTESKTIPVTVLVPRENARSGANQINVELVSLDQDSISVKEKTTFLLPH